jgi:hypothetical protein
MNLLSGLFGRSAPSAPSAPLNFDIKNGWYRNDDDIKKVSDLLSKHPLLRLMSSHDPMDDFNILTLSLAASQFECVNLDTTPILICRARKNGLNIILEIFFQFKDKFFASRGKIPTVRLRFDEDEPITCAEDDTSYSTNKSSLFFQRFDPFQKSLVNNLLRLQIIPERGEPIIATFDFTRTRPAFEFFAEAICGPDFKEILACHSKLLDHFLRMGPKNVLTYKKALASLRLNPGSADYTKTVSFIKAIQSYAETRHSWEIYGTLGGNMNQPWTSILSKEVSSRIRQEIGPLKLFD